MALIRNEIYDDNGLVEVQYIEVENEIDLISEKENELLKLYEEIKQLRENKI
jgi:hypothetical protein